MKLCFTTNSCSDPNFDCLRDAPDRQKDGKPLPLILPGEIAGLNAQCRALNYTRACLVNNNSKCINFDIK